jgi:hypothetical protein
MLEGTCTCQEIRYQLVESPSANLTAASAGFQNRVTCGYFDLWLKSCLQFKRGGRATTWPSARKIPA